MASAVRHALAIVTVAASWCALAAAQPPAPVQLPIFKSSIDLVRVDVNVVDRASGVPVGDLTPVDFLLTIDGRPRPLTSAQFIRVVPSVRDTRATAAALTYTSNRTAQTGRLVMIVADTANIAPGRAKLVFRTASRFVASLDAADRVAVAAIPLGPQTDFTLNHIAARAVLENLDGRALGNGVIRTVTVAEALAFERGDQFKVDQAITRECGAAPTSDRAAGSDFAVCVNQVQQEASLVAAETHTQARATIAALQKIIARLAANDAPKTLIFVSEGLVIDREPALLAWLSNAAAAAHVTVYALQIDRDDTDASNARIPVSRMADRAVQSEGLEAMALFGRGEMFRVVAGAESAFARIANELAAYYLLAFEPDAADRDGRPHQIKVATRRSGAVVRARPEFTVGTAPPRTTAQVLVDTLQSSEPAIALPLTVTTYSLQAQPPKVRVLIAADIDRGDDAAASATVGFVMVDAKGAVVANHTEPLAAGKGSAHRQRYVTAADVDPGIYTLKMAVVDDAGRTGSVGRTFAATLNRFGSIRSSDLLVASNDSASPASNGANVIADADVAGGPLRAGVQLVADTPAAFANVSVAIEISETETSPALQTAPARLADGGTHRAAEAIIPLSQFAPGDYVARAIISVEGRPVGRVARPFRIASATAPRH
jgi:VWFA-related protein